METPLLTNLAGPPTRTITRLVSTASTPGRTSFPGNANMYSLYDLSGASAGGRGKDIDPNDDDNALKAKGAVRASAHSRREVRAALLSDADVHDLEEHAKDSEKLNGQIQVRPPTHHRAVRLAARRPLAQAMHIASLGLEGLIQTREGNLKQSAFPNLALWQRMLTTH